MPAVNLALLPTVPYIYSGTTPAVVNTCQLVTIPSVPGVSVTIHNRDKASKTLRISFDTSLTQGGAAPSMYFSVGEPIALKTDSSSHSGFQPAHVLALFSDSASVNYELIFTPS